MRTAAIGVLLVTAIAHGATAQTPAGTVSGVVTDASGLRLGGVGVRVTGRDTSLTRETRTSADGEYGIAALLPGAYVLSANLQGFKRVQRDVQVDAGSRTVADLALTPGDVRETVTVNGAAPLMRPDDHYVGGVVTRAQIDNLPLNGRNFLDLAKLEPGVSNPVRAAFGRTFISVLGSGLQTIPRVGYTRVTVDGASINGFGTVGTFLQVSQEAVQEFQVSTANVDAATGLTTNGAVNVITRSGGSVPHAGAFSFFRDHHVSAFPGLKRSVVNPDPFFQRHQFGGTAGGPLSHHRLFYFASLERNDERSVATVQATAPEFAALGGIFPSPAVDNLMTVRVDAALGSRHTMFVRQTLDRNSTFSGAAATLPSGWSRLTNHAGQTLVSLTSMVAPTLVNELRVGRFTVDSTDIPAGAGDCAGCFGLGAIRTTIAEAGLTFGRTRTTVIEGKRYQVSDVLSWQKDRHRVRVGADWEHSSSLAANPDPAWAEMTVWSPARMRQFVVPVAPVFASVADITQLSLQAFDTTVGPPIVPWRDFSDRRTVDVYRAFVSDSWHTADRLTLNAALGWSLEPNALNTDLSKPDLLAPLLGAGGLHPPRVSYTDFAPAGGLAWSITRDRKTLLRAGAGHYSDPVSSTNSVNLANERLALLPLGVGRLTRTGANIPFGSGTLAFTSRPTAFTAAQLLDLLPGIQGGLLSLLDSSNRDVSLRNLNRLKEGANLYDPNYRAPSSLQLTAGVQRELPDGLVLTADIVWKRFTHTFINGIDYNRFNSRGGPIIPACTAAQQQDATALCSNGNLFFDTTTGRARYRGLLVRAEKRFNGRWQLLGSYALGSYVGTNGTGLGTAEATGGRVFGFNNDNWYENSGPLPTDIRHMFNLSGVVRLPYAFQASFTVAAYSRPPFSAFVAAMDFNGDGTRNDLLPGSTVNAFNRSLNEADLRRLVDAYNASYAGRVTAGGQFAPSITLPDRWSFDDRFFTQDVRLARTLPLGIRRGTISLMVDVFNVFNTANLVQFSGNLAAHDTFGQPSGRFTQLFGSGGPRAVQFAARVGF